MKYNININQYALMETNLDLIDSAILDYLIVICNSKNKKIEKKRIKGFTWIKYNKLIDDMPLLKIKSKGAITPRIRRIEKNGYINIRIINQKMHVGLTDKIDELFIEMNSKTAKPFTKMNRTVHHNEQPAIHENEHDNNININNKIKSNVNVAECKENSHLSESEKGRLYYHLDKINDRKNIKAWQNVIDQIGFAKTINILIDVSESRTAKSKGACAMGIAKKIFKFIPNKDRPYE